MDLQAIAEWGAPAATMIAAMMTAANLGARVTGSGFIVFTVGSLLWSYIGMSTGQTGLLVTNGFLTLVNLIGIWRWLGRQRAYEDGAKSAAEKSETRPGSTLVGGAGFAAMPLIGRGGDKIGHGVDVLLCSRDRSIAYVVLALTEGEALSERVVAVAGEDLEWHCDRVVLRRDNAWLERAPTLTDGDWPDEAEALAWRGET